MVSCSNSQFTSKDKLAYLYKRFIQMFLLQCDLSAALLVARHRTIHTGDEILHGT